MDEAYLIGTAVGALVGAIIWGVVAKKINESKGYYGGFWWGFFLGIIGVIVVAVKPPIQNTYVSRNPDGDGALSSLANEENEKRLLREGGWRCLFCDRVNPSYVTSCVCGHSLRESREKMLADEKAKAAPPKPAPQPVDLNAELEKYQALLDKGLINEADYEAKKKQILGI